MIEPAAHILLGILIGAFLGAVASSGKHAARMRQAKADEWQRGYQSGVLDGRVLERSDLRREGKLVP